ncbi:solute carrier family 22 member 21 [Plakobranchus ocellatus]|uniref:Solute carrier family 22 member 21 n=1 Tax=Plakobranchus ocellatus TaxID=259542 RepID=A0AAV4DJ80_9GAST|nr:solute carrier family 22 member 21 [Plakobranchus ocellatus]
MSERRQHAGSREQERGDYKVRSMALLLQDPCVTGTSWRRDQEGIWCPNSNSMIHEFACPNIVSRSEWNARAPKSVSYLSHQPLQYAFIHHSDSPAECLTKDRCASAVRSFQNYHMDSRGWHDIGYSFLIGGEGTVFEGRGWDRVGAHTKNYNSVGLGFCFIGNFMTKNPTQVQLNSAKRLIECGVELGKLKSNYTVRGHRDMGSTLCPGDILYNIIRGWPQYH